MNYRLTDQPDQSKLPNLALSCLAALLILPYVIFFVPYVNMHLWNWFMPTLFHLPQLNYWATWGVSVVLVNITGLAQTSMLANICGQYQIPPEKLNVGLFTIFTAPLFTLLIGYLVHLWM